MTTRSAEVEAIAAVLERVKAAVEPDQALEEAIHALLLPEDSWWNAICEARRLVAAGKGHEYVETPSLIARAESWNMSGRVARYTSSIDAALALVERALPGTMWAAGSMEAGPFCRLVYPRSPGWGLAESLEQEGGPPTEPLAILAALLSALLAQQEPTHADR